MKIDKVSSLTTLNIGAQAAMAIHLAIFTSFFDPAVAALYLSAYLYRDIVMRINIGELQALLFSSKYHDTTLEIKKFLLFICLSIAQILCWAIILTHINIPYFIVAIILVEYLCYIPVNLVKGFGKIKEAMILQLALSLIGLVSIIVMWVTNIESINLYIRIRLVTAVLFLVCISIFTKYFFLKNVHQDFNGLTNVRAQFASGMLLQAKEVYLLAFIVVPKFIANNILKPEEFTKFMVAFALVSAVASYIQAINQRKLYLGLNFNKKQNLNIIVFFLQLMCALILGLICYYAAASWINKDFAKLSFTELQPVIILMFSLPVMLMPVVFLSFRTERYTMYHAFPVLILLAGLLNSVYSSNISVYGILMFVSILSILFLSKSLITKS